MLLAEVDEPLLPPPMFGQLGVLCPPPVPPPLLVEGEFPGGVVVPDCAYA
jgi:hypothetical protein